MKVRLGQAGTERTLKFDFGKSGLEIAFFDYQIEMLEVLWAEKKEYLPSKEIWDRIVDDDEYPSRASVTFSLNWMVAKGIVDCKEITGKGGRYGTYKARLSEEELWRWLAVKVITKLSKDSGIRDLFA